MATNAGGTARTDSATFTTPAMTKADWRQQYFGTIEGSGSASDLADPDGDRQVNLLEFAFGTDPTAAQSQLSGFAGTGDDAVITPGRELLFINLDAASNQTTLRLRFIRRKNHASQGLIYTAQWSPDLFAWTSSTALPAVVADDGILQVVEVSLPVDPDDPEMARFCRIVVSALD